MELVLTINFKCAKIKIFFCQRLAGNRGDTFQVGPVYTTILVTVAWQFHFPSTYLQHKQNA